MFGPTPSTDELAAFILPWAKTAHPEKYQQTLAVAGKADTFRRYLLRLIEIRCEQERGFIGTVPVMMLHETKLTCRVRLRGTDTVLTIGGRLSTEPRQMTFAMLSLAPEEFASLREWMTVLDLEPIDDTRRTAT